MGFELRRRLREPRRAPCERIGDCAVFLPLGICHGRWQLHGGMTLVDGRVGQGKSKPEAGFPGVEVGALSYKGFPSLS